MVGAVYPIVEGHGEVVAVPILLRRIIEEACGRHDVHVLTPHRIPRGRIFSGDYLEMAVELGTKKLGQYSGRGAIFVLIDANSDCPALRAPEILDRVKRPNFETRVVMAKVEYEAWFLASIGSIAQELPRIRRDAVPPSDPEAVAGAKEFLENEFLESEFRYAETVDQPAFTAMMSFSEAKLCPSFDKCWRDVVSLFAYSASQ